MTLLLAALALASPASDPVRRIESLITSGQFKAAQRLAANSSSGIPKNFRIIFLKAEAEFQMDDIFAAAGDIDVCLRLAPPEARPLVENLQIAIGARLRFYSLVARANSFAASGHSLTAGELYEEAWRLTPSRVDVAAAALRWKILARDYASADALAQSLEPLVVDASLRESLRDVEDLCRRKLSAPLQ